jgi:hypothetical protein
MQGWLLTPASLVKKISQPQPMIPQNLFNILQCMLQ